MQLCTQYNVRLSCPHRIEPLHVHASCLHTYMRTTLVHTALVHSFAAPMHCHVCSTCFFIPSTGLFRTGVIAGFPCLKAYLPPVDCTFVYVRVLTQSFPSSLLYICSCAHSTMYVYHVPIGLNLYTCMLLVSSHTCAQHLYTQHLYTVSLHLCTAMCAQLVSSFRQQDCLEQE